MEEIAEKIVVKNATFITSAASERQFLRPEKPLIAVCGKSNVGKSSFINLLAGRKKLAKTSREPGRTRLVNYFDFGEFLLADLPGYGFARVSAAEKKRWGQLLDAFFGKKERLAHVLVLLDCRHDPTADDVQMIAYLHAHAIPFTAVLTKADKLSRMKLKEHITAIAADLYLGAGNLIPTSAETRQGREEVLERIACVLACARDAGTAETGTEPEENEDNEEYEGPEAAVAAGVPEGRSPETSE